MIFNKIKKKISNWVVNLALKILVVIDREVLSPIDIEHFAQKKTICKK